MQLKVHLHVSLGSNENYISSDPPTHNTAFDALHTQLKEITSYINNQKEQKYRLIEQIIRLYASGLSETTELETHALVSDLLSSKLQLPSKSLSQQDVSEDINRIRVKLGQYWLLSPSHIKEVQFYLSNRFKLPGSNIYINLT